MTGYFLNTTLVTVTGGCPSATNATAGQLFALFHYASGNIARRILDGNKATAKLLVAHSRGGVSVERISCEALLRAYAVGSPVADIERGGTPDDIIRAELLKIGVLTDNSVSIRNISWLGMHLINPSVVPFSPGKLLLATSTSWNLAGGVYSADLEFAWIDISPLKAGEGHIFQTMLLSAACQSDMGVSCQRLGVANHTRARLSSPPAPRVLGQDVRLLPVGGRTGPPRMFVQFSVMPHFTQPFNPGYRASHVQMGAAFLAVSANGTLVYDELYNGLRLQEGDGSDQKNFVPFVYTNGSMQEVLLIQRINPLRVVAMDRERHASDAAAGRGSSYLMPLKEVSAAPFVRLGWDHGEIRGGTPALPYCMPDGSPAYLAFFHSSRTLPGSTMRTYFMGAFAFSSHAPFLLLAVSRQPLVHPQLYTGPWSAVKARGIDYTVFPSSFYFDCGAQLSDPGQCDRIVLTVGFQDLHGLAMLLSAAEVVRAMEPVAA